ncbi:regulatory protein GemA [Rhizobium puerariae]|uniref:Regulatory protein GemA n=1 Tax=Rhizobium puerariae TaxID=1585791 RepID=A0ABV6AMZ1_9HYPH
MADLTGRHFSILRVAKAQLGLSDDDYRAVLHRISGQESATGLNAKSSKKVMAHFEAMGFLSTAKKKEFSRRPGKASDAQLRKIRQLWAEFTDGTGDDTSLRHWMEKHRHGHGIQWLQADGAHKVIGALTNMVRRKKTTAQG